MQRIEGSKRNVAVITLLTTTCASFLTPFISSAVNVALPSIGMEFGLDTAMLGWVQASFLLSTAVFLIPFGKVADIVGRKKTFLTGLLIYTLASLFASIATSAWALILFRVLQGVGGAMLAATSVAILSSAFPPKDRGKVLGINSASVYTAIASGPFLGGILTECFGWRSIFFVNVPVGLLSLLLALQIKQEWRSSIKERFDLPGSILYALSLVAMMWGMLSLSSSSIEARSSSAFALLSGLALLAFFVILEGRIQNPIIDMRLFTRNVAFSFSNISALINYSATYALSFLLSLYLQVVKGLSPRLAGTVLIAQPVVQALLSPIAGWLSDKLSPWKVASMGIALNSIGLFIFSTINADTSILSIVAMLLLMGIGFALFVAPNTNAIMSSVSRDLFGIASATLSTMRAVGQVLSIALATLILSIFVGPGALSQESLNSLIEGVRFAFLTFAAMCAIGVITSLIRGRGAA